MISRKESAGSGPAGCWVEVGVEDGELVSIAADETHPLGMICRRGQHAPESRPLEAPAHEADAQEGAEGDLRLRAHHLDEAYDAIAWRLREFKRESGPESVAIYTGRGAFELSLCDMFQPKGVSVSSASNVLFPFGSPNTRVSARSATSRSP